MLHASSVFSPTSARKCWRGVSKRRTPFSLSLFLCFSVSLSLVLSLSLSLTHSLALSFFLVFSFALLLSICLYTMAKICRVISFRASPIGAGVLLECQLRIFLLKARAHTGPARNSTFEHARYVSRVKASVQ